MTSGKIKCCRFIIQLPFILLEEVIDRIWPPIDSWAGPRQLEPSHLIPCPWNVCSAHPFHSGSWLQGCNLERLRCCWDHLDGNRAWTQLRPLQNRYGSDGSEWRSARLQLSQQALLSKFPRLFNPPVQSGVDCFLLRLSLPSAEGPCLGFHLQNCPGYEPTPVGPPGH